MSEIQRVNGELRERITALESGVELTELRARNGDLERLAGELKSLNGELRRANARLREVTPANNPAEQQMQQLQQGEHDRLRARVVELEQALAHATSDVEALRAAAREAVVGVPSDLAALEQSLRDSKQLLGRARADARAAQQNAEDARGALQAATEALDAADEEQSAIRREADEAREQLVQYKERSARLVIAESVAAAARATEQQRRATDAAIGDAVQRGKRSMAASAAADVARIRAKYIALLSQAQEQQQQQQQQEQQQREQQAPTLTDEPTSNKRLSDAIAETASSTSINESAPAKKRVTVNSGTQTVGWSREHDLDCLRFSHDLLVQKMAEMRGQFVQKLQHMNRLHDALEQRRQNEAQEWNEMLSTTVESLKTQMSNGLKESVLRVRQLQSELESEQQLNERLASDMEQLRRRTSSESQLSDLGEENATGAASPVARAMERLRSQLGASRARVEELETENELLMEKLVEFESRTTTVDATAATAAAIVEGERAVDEVESEANEESKDVEHSGAEERMAAQVDAMECFPSAELMANITVTRRGRGGGRR